MRRSVTIVGASLAGLRAAETLRRDGFAGAIRLVGDEVHEPYDRPPLSKQLLAGDWEVDRTVLTPAERLGALGLEIRLGVRATGLDVAARLLEVDGGRAHPIDQRPPYLSAAAGSPEEFVQNPQGCLDVIDWPT